MSTPTGTYTRPVEPADLLELAEQEPEQTDLGDYFKVILTLRRKGFSFREIADWMSERGVETDYNAVYRIFTKYSSPEQQAEEEQREQDEALEDQGRANL